MNDVTPLIVAVVSALVAVYATWQTRGAQKANIGQTYTEKYLERLERRVDKLEKDNEMLKEAKLKTEEENIRLKRILLENGIVL